MSALTWRVLDQRTRNDYTLIRHVHDLAALEPLATVHQAFPELLRQLLETDATRGATNPNLDALTPVERLATALDALTPSVALDSVWCEHLLVSAAMPHRPAPLKLGYELLCCTP